MKNKNEIQRKLRDLPSVDSLLGQAEELIQEHGRTIVTAAVRREIGAAREEILRGHELETGVMLSRVAERIDRESGSILKRVVNATGVILHTGLGRAVMPGTVASSLADMTGACSLQMDLETGERIRREHNVCDLVRDLTGAEDSLVVNNNAGATMLVLRALAQGRKVVVSRGELIEIGGSFRLPEIMEQSGAVLKEVGSTNKTHLRDYEGAISDDTAMLLKAHKSNYEIVGFTKEVAIAEIAELGKSKGVPVVDDIGCGALIGLEAFGLGHEMTMRESIEAGADIVLSSTDKLIGGPQGGLIIGRADLLARIRSCPLYRALRVGKMTLAALEATLRLFRAPERLAVDHPVYRMMAKSVEGMREEAEKLCALIQGQCPEWQVSAVDEKSYIGGGSLPGTHMPSVAVRIVSGSETTKDISLKFRKARIPVVPYIDNDAVLLNMRTVFEEDLDDIVAACSAGD